MVVVVVWSFWIIQYTACFIDIYRLSVQSIRMIGDIDAELTILCEKKIVTFCKYISARVKRACSRLVSFSSLNWNFPLLPTFLLQIGEICERYLAIGAWAILWSRLAWRERTKALFQTNLWDFFHFLLRTYILLYFGINNDWRVSNSRRNS